jgi:predicted RNA-binding protein with PUA domain
MSRPRYPGRELYQAHVEIDGVRHRVRICDKCNLETLADPCDECGDITRTLYSKRQITDPGEGDAA